MDGVYKEIRKPKEQGVKDEDETVVEEISSFFEVKDGKFTLNGKEYQINKDQYCKNERISFYLKEEGEMQVTLFFK